MSEYVRSVAPTVAQIIQMMLGVIFLVAGASKIWEPVLFFWQTYLYKDVLGLGANAAFSVSQAALMLGPLECGVGLALIVNWRPKLVFSVASALLIFFFGLTFFAWRQGFEASCGCFGPLIEQGPGEAAIEDLLMFGLLMFAWWGTESLNRPAWVWGRYFVLGGTLLTLAIGGMRFFPEMHRLKGSDLQLGVGLSRMKLKDSDLDLSQRTVLLVLFSPECSRCGKAVPKLNAYRDIPGLPPIVALTHYDKDSEQISDFVAHHRPDFEIISISKKDFVRLTWQHGYPRLAFVRKGMVEAVWEYYAFPSKDQLRALIF